MHKYQPRVHLVKMRDDQIGSADALQSLDNLDVKTYVYTETVFIGVTAYQNQLVSERRCKLGLSLEVI